MSRETNLWRYLKRNMQNRWAACRHEDSVTLGVPDVSYAMHGTHGWIELKVIDTWPVKEITVVKLDHFTPWQRRWLRDRGERGGFCWLLLKVSTPRTYLLFSWDKLPHVGNSDKRTLIKKAIAVWYTNIDWTELENMLNVKI